MAFFPSLREAFSALLFEVQGRRVSVFGHARPDGDCIGSQVALARILGAAGAAAECVNPDPVPRRLGFLTAGTPFTLGCDYVRAGQLAIFADCADEGRINRSLLERITAGGAGLDACFDHHLSNGGFARRNFIVPECAATAELVAGLAFDAGLPVDAGAADALYVGLMTDTGRFSFPNTGARVFALVARLIACGADPARCASEVYERETPQKLALLQQFLASLTFDAGGRICIGTLPEGVFARTGATAEDTEGLVDYARGIDGVEIGVLLEERPGVVKGSIRARRAEVRADLVAADFNGGGHACAAGFRLHDSLAPVRARLLAALRPRLPAP